MSIESQIILQEAIKKVYKELKSKTETVIFYKYLEDIKIDPQFITSTTNNTTELNIYKEQIYKAYNKIKGQFKRFKAQFIKMINADEDINMESNSQVTLESLAQALQTLIQVQTQQKVHTTKATIPHPPVYGGDRDIIIINNWISSVERYLEFTNVPQEKWVTFAISYLNNRALLWWNRNSTTLKSLTWKEFHTKLTNTFTPLFAQHAARDRLDRLNQYKITIEQYVKEFQDTMLELDITEEEAKHKFISKLKPLPKQHVILSKPANLEEAYENALIYSAAVSQGQTIMEPTINNHQSIPSATVDDPMDLSLLQQQNALLLNLLNQRNQTIKRCYNCQKPGHIARECRSNNNNNNRTPFSNRNNNTNRNYNSNPSSYNNNRRDQFNSNNHRGGQNNRNQSRQQFNAIMNTFDPLPSDNNNNNHYNNHNSNSSFFNTDNKNLIDLDTFGTQESSSYPVLTPIPFLNNDPSPTSDLSYLNNIGNSHGLPIYQALVGGSHFKVLIDSGASTCYVHPKLISHALSINNITNQAAETADGKQSNINKRIAFRMFLGDQYEHQEIVTAFVFESKFDIILGRSWLKGPSSPCPDWFDDTWEIKCSNPKLCKIKIHPLKANKVEIPNSINSIIQKRYDSHTTNPNSFIFNDTSKNDSLDIDYLISASQVARLFKKKQVTECYVVNFLDETTGNVAAITPIPPTNLADLQIDKDWKAEFAKIYPHVFKGDVTELPPHRDTRDIIVTDPKDAPPIYHHPYRMSPIELTELKRQLADLEKKGLIVPTASPYGFPILFVKQGSKLRMCADYRSLNKITIAQRIPIPRIDECLDQLHGAQYFSQIDFKGAFNQVRLSESDSMKTTISHRFGQHRFLVTPYGLKNSGAYFQSTINKVLKDYIDKFAQVYVDDILVYSKTEKEHKEHVKLILQRLNEEKFIINIDKTHFNIKELTFLGFNISKNGILPSKQKTEAIIKWPTPTNVQQIRQFLGLAQHYRRFIPEFDTIASPLTDLTAGTGYKTRSINWTVECQAAFDLLKKKLISAPILMTPDMNKPFRIECDSSDFAAGAVLLQQDERNEWRPLAYESKRYSKEERSYPAQERELLAILIALRKWRCFIDGKKYTVYTDHLPLKYYRSQKHPVPRLIRWMSEIELYNPDIQYKAGKENIVPDLLSRRDGPNCTPAVKSIKPRYLYNINENTNQKSHSISKPTKSIQDDPVQDWPLLFFRDPAQWPELLKKELQQNQHKFIVKDQQIYRLHKPQKSNDTIQLKFIPFGKRADLIDDFHTAYGHLSKLSVYQQMKDRVWWPKMQNDIIDWLKFFPHCQLASHTEKNIHHAPMKPLDIPPAFSRWHIDFIGELPETKNGNKWLLVAVDYATNWVSLRALKRASGDEIVKFIYEEIVQKFGCPTEIVSDCGQNLMSKVLKQYMIKIRSKHTVTHKTGSMFGNFAYFCSLHDGY